VPSRKECRALLGIIATEDTRVCDILARHVTCLGGEAMMLPEGSYLMRQTERTCNERIRSYVRRTERMIQALDGARCSIAEDALRNDVDMIGRRFQRNSGRATQIFGKLCGSPSPET
jgi:hypothetical protein